MKIVNIKEDSDFLSEYIELCSYEWGKQKSNLVNINDEDDIILYLEYNNLLLDE